MFLSSKSQRRFGFANQTSRCTFQWDKSRIHEARSFSGPNVSRFLQDPICLGPKMKVSDKQTCILSHLLSSESDSVFSLTPVCLVVSFPRGVLTVFVFALHPDSLMMSGACLKSGSMSKYCPVHSVPTHTVQQHVRDGICFDPPLCRGTSQGKKGSRIIELVCKGETVGKIGEVDEMGGRELVLVVSVGCGKRTRHDTWMTIVSRTQRCAILELEPRVFAR